MEVGSVRHVERSTPSRAEACRWMAGEAPPRSPGQLSHHGSASRYTLFTTQLPDTLAPELKVGMGGIGVRN